MRLAYTTTFDSRDVHEWSGTPYHMSRALAEAGIDIEYVGPLERKLPPYSRLRKLWYRYVCNQRETRRFNTVTATHYSQQLAKRLQHMNVDAVISPLFNPISYLDCKQPIVLWTDAVYAGLLGFYAPFAYHTARSVQEGNAMTASCLSRCSLAIFSSEWAANSAIQLYGADRNKVKVVNYGANIESHPSLAEIRTTIKQRAQNKIKLLFLGKSWERKGGDIVVSVAKALHEAGHPVELNIVGYTPELGNKPSYINCLGFISKQTAEGKQRIAQLLHDSHFLFLPSRADACPMVFAEANAFGLPVLTSHVGGIASAITDNINGMTFSLDATSKTYCDYIVNLFHDRARYEALALSAHNEYETRLNWQAATAKVKTLIQEIL